MPRSTVPDDGVEDGEEFAGDGDDGDHLRLTGSDQALMECLELGVPARRDHGPHEDGGADGSAAPADEAAASPFLASASITKVM